MKGKTREYIGRLGTYGIGKQIGQGGNGRVFQVNAPDGSTGLAIKILNSEASNSKRQRFKNEMHFCQNAEHPNIIRVRDFNRDSDVPAEELFYVMPRYEFSLREAMNTGMTPHAALKTLLDIMAGVRYAHERNVIHRDLKPDNILISTGPHQAVIADFGIAHISPEFQATAIQTQTGERLDNRGYASPEQRHGWDVSFPSDVFSLGLILSEMLTGQIPYGTGFPKIANVNPKLAFLDDLGLRPPRDSRFVVELGASGLAGKHPVDFGLSSVGSSVPGTDFFAESPDLGKATIAQTLARQQA